MSPPANTKPRILIVDDEPLNRDLMRRVLHSGWDVDDAEDADAALAKLEAADGAYDAVLCDQLMPGRSGTELAADVQARWPGKPFLLITGYEDDPEVRQSVTSGVVTQVVTKPWTAKSLKALLSGYTGGQ